MSRTKVIEAGKGFIIYLEKEMIKYSYSGRITFEIKAKAVSKKYPSEYVWERSTSVDKREWFSPSSWESRILKAEERLIKDAKSCISKLPDLDKIFG